MDGESCLEEKYTWVISPGNKHDSPSMLAQIPTRVRDSEGNGHSDEVAGADENGLGTDDTATNSVGEDLHAEYGGEV